MKRRTVNYRKIYEEHYGSIPSEPNGRKYDIHHLDGNHENNSPENLVAIPIQEHYDIHFANEDYFACYLIMTQRMSKTPNEISRIATLNNLQRVKNGTNPLVGGELQKRTSKEYWKKMGQNHPAAIATRERIKNGTHHLLGGGEKHPNYDKTVYKFFNLLTKETVEMTQHELSRKYNLHSGAVSDMVNKKRNVSSVKKWVLVDAVNNPIIRENPRKDKTIYTFENVKTKEVIIMTRHDFAKKIAVNKSALSPIITGTRKTVHGWAIKK